MSRSSQIYKLLPGDVAIGERGDQLETLLGSCVSIVLTDPRRTLGAMCHIVHSSQDIHHREATTSDAATALKTMVNLLQARGLSANLCDAYVFGGGNMFPDLVEGTSVGDLNAQWALDALTSMGVRILSVDVGGNVYRQLRWTVGVDAPQINAVSVCA
ncbi:MAG TPA: chemotaxis protein CheD [Aquabacterium sp.]|uniref:chemotaxis protein CheD n=1 Tax=Aquabacterium sp. TaxID=1872578 RepID=UPI002E3323BA|nr:chemotaxis protein CheD [Aquabacterium sp.]HEX5357555.1 chemotaxis protein CheD [Aquabacterium sp.]